MGSCVNNPFKSVARLSKIIDEAKTISKKEFLENCDIEDFKIYDMKFKRAIKEFPNDFEFFRNGKIIFFTHSCIEHFFS